mmetsp:Transcript_123727/g.309248  ORF Transcript_123727/g.309248 Transcript_123727/m.309248 type:complete len:995 (-) Transcript_123727:32-3016(-)
MIDPELAAKLQRRRGVVDTKGDEWETVPEASSADAVATEWIIPETAAAAAQEVRTPSNTTSSPRADAAGSGGDAGAKSPAKAEELPDETTLQALLARLRTLGRTDEGRALLLAQTPAVRKALAARVKSAQVARQQAEGADCTQADATGGSQQRCRAEVERERAKLAAECAIRWPRLLGSAEASGAEGVMLGDLSEADMRTIRADVQRTRKGDAAFQEPEMLQRLERLLTGFCIKEKIRYTQGLHELAAVFAFLQAMAPDGGMDDSSTLACFIAFVHKFVPYLHDDETFVTLHISLLFFRQLILYHHPDLHNQLAESGVSPFAYATPWFMTLFAARTPLSVLLKLWDQYIARGEDHFLPFLAVAMLVGEKTAILAADKDEAHSAVGRAGLKNLQHLEEVWAEAEALKARTPKSFVIRMSKVIAAVKERRGQQQDTERPWSERVLGEVEKQRRFVVLSGEVAAHCVHEKRNSKGELEAAPVGGAHTLRFMLLDLRPPEEQIAEILPQALHFHPQCLRRLVAAAGKGSQPRLERLAAALSSAVSDLRSGLMASASGTSGSDSQGAQEAVAPNTNPSATAALPSSLRMQIEDASLVTEVFAALQEAATERWGEDWLSESACAHLVLLGGAADIADFQGKTSGGGGGAVVPLYEVLTEHLSLARVSVALGGASAISKEATKRGFELAESKVEPSTPAEGGPDTWTLGSAWSRLQAASEALPLPVVEKAKGSLGDLWHTGAEKARTLAGSAALGIKESAAAVRQQAAEGAAVVRQSAAESMTVIGNLMERLDNDITTGHEGAGGKDNTQEGSEGSTTTAARTWICEAWVVGQPEGSSEGAEGAADKEREVLREATLRLSEAGELVVLVGSGAGVDAGEELQADSDLGEAESGHPQRCAFAVEALQRVGTSQAAPRVLGFYFPAPAAATTIEAADEPKEDGGKASRPSLLARFPTPEEAKSCARAIAGAAAVAKRKRKAAKGPAQASSPQKGEAEDGSEQA